MPAEPVTYRICPLCKEPRKYKSPQDRTQAEEREISYRVEAMRLLASLGLPLFPEKEHGCSF